jgi:hypothetical protein
LVLRFSSLYTFLPTANDQREDFRLDLGGKRVFREEEEGLTGGRGVYGFRQAQRGTGQSRRRRSGGEVGVGVGVGGRGRGGGGRGPWLVSIISSICSSIDMYNNDVGKRFMK